MAPLVKLKPVDEDPASHFLFETTQAAARSCATASRPSA